MARKVLLVIDLQKEFKDKTGEKYQKCLDFIKEKSSEYDVVIGTYFKNALYDENNFYVKNLNWAGCADTSEKSVEYNYDNLFEKTGYAFWRNSTFYTSDNVDIIGCDLEACVMATAFTLWDKGIPFRVLTNYCYTTGFESDQELLKAMRRTFGNCIVSE